LNLPVKLSFGLTDSHARRHDTTKSQEQEQDTGTDQSDRPGFDAREKHGNPASAQASQSEQPSKPACPRRNGNRAALRFGHPQRVFGRTPVNQPISKRR
jgi:hypothetical protein